jgi:hypothetical protein
VFSRRECTGVIGRPSVPTPDSDANLAHCCLKAQVGMQGLERGIDGKSSETGPQR